MSIKKRLAAAGAVALFCLSAMAGIWNSVSHKVLIGDYNGDGIEDIYLKAKDLIVLVGQMPLAPISVKGKWADWVLVGSSNGSFTLASPLDTAKLAQVAWKEGIYEAHFADLTGTGNNSLVLRPVQTGRNLLIFNDANGKPSFVQSMSPQQVTTDFATSAGQRISFIDVNRDGLLDIVFSKPGSPDTVLLSSAGGQLRALSVSGTEDSFKAETANVWGGTVGSGDVSPTGQFAYNYPLAVAVGVNGLQPTLSISHTGGERSTYLGAGWNLSGLQVVSRCPAVKYIHGQSRRVGLTEADEICLNGTPLKLVSGTHWKPEAIYHKFVDDISRVYIRSVTGGVSFEVRDQAGLIYTFGETAQARFAPDGTRTFAWYLEKVQDRFGNTIHYDYLKDNGYLYPSKIRYADARVEFSYFTSGHDVTYVGGGKSVRQLLLRTITSYAPDGNLFRKHTVGYNLNANGKDRVEFLQTCGYSQGALDCLAEERFSYKEGVNGLTATTTTSGFNAPNRAATSEQLILDWNGDGYLDYIVSSERSLHLTLGSKTGFGQPQIIFTGSLDISIPHALRVFDSNRDGVQEVLFVYFSKFEKNRTWVIDGVTGQYDTYEMTWHLLGEGINRVLYVPSVRVDWANYLFPTYSGTNYMQRAGYRTAALPTVMDIDNDGDTDFLVPFKTSQRGGWMSCIVGDIARANCSEIKGIGMSAVGGGGYPWFQYLGRNNAGANLLLTAIPGANSKAQFAVVEWAGDSFKVTGNGILVERSVITDLNGDGNIDVVAPDSSGNVAVYFNKGDGFLAGSFEKTMTSIRADLLLPVESGRSSNGDYIPREIDFFGDGNHGLLYVADGKFALFSYRNGAFKTESLGVPVSTLPDGSLAKFTRDIMIADWDGDGQQDILNTTSVSGAYTWKLIKQQRTQPYNLTQVTDSLGNTTKISYGNLMNPEVYTPSSITAGLFRRLLAPLWVATEQTSSNGAANAIVQSYRYTSGRYDSDGFGFLGFGQRITKNQLTGDELTEGFYTDPTYLGLKHGETLKRNDIKRSVKQYSWFKKPPLWSKAVDRVWLEKTQEDRYLPTGEIYNSLVTSFKYDDQHTKTFQSDGFYRDGWRIVSKDQTALKHTSDPNAWLMGFVQQNFIADTTNDASQGRYETTTEYEQLPGTLVPQRVIENKAKGALQRTVDYSYDSAGNITQQSVTVSGEIRTTKFEDFAYQRFPRLITNAAGHVRALTYDVGSGKVLQEVDPNNLVSLWRYDLLGRETRSVSMDGTQTLTEYRPCASDCPAGGTYQATSRRLDGSGTQTIAPTSITYFDSKGRVLRESTQSFDGRWSLKDYKYDAKGRLDSVSEPYFSGESPLFTTYKYDDFDRKSLVTYPNNRSENVSYSPRTGDGYIANVTLNYQGGAASVTTVYEYDIRGLLVKVINGAGSSEAVELAHSYDARGHRQKTFMSGKNLVTTGYDLDDNLSYQLDARGQRTYEYDGFGQLRKEMAYDGYQTAVRASYAYDKLARVTERKDKPGTSEEQVYLWVYDDGLAAKGKLTGLTTKNYVEALSYDSLGRLKRKGWTIHVNGQPSEFFESYDYDSAGRLAVTTLPSSATINHTYNPYGYLKGEATASNQVLREVLAQDARGNSLSERYIGNFKINRTFDAATGLQRTLEARNSSGALLSQRYNYDGRGSLVERVDGVIGLNETFGYDLHNRLTSHLKQWTSGPKQQELYEYDLFGNLRFKTGVGRYRYSDDGGYADGGAFCRKLGTFNFSYSAVLGVESHADPICYDHLGNMRLGLGRTITYNVSDKPIRIEANGTTTRFEYDPQGQRFVQYTPQTTTVYLDEGTAEQVRSGGRTWFNSYQGNLILYAEGAKQEWSTLVRDPLGSIVGVVDQQGNLKEKQAFAAFGERLTGDGRTVATAGSFKSTKRGFTGHEHIDQNNLIHMNGRVYDPVLGRFLSADVAYQSNSNVQAFNRYSYGFNSPLNGTDPSGYIWYDPFSWDWAGARNLAIPGQSFFDPIPTYGPWANGYGIGQDLISYNFGSFATETGERFSNALYKGRFDTDAGVHAWALGLTNSLDAGGSDATKQFLGENPPYGATKMALETVLGSGISLSKYATELLLGRAGSIRNINFLGGSKNCVNCAISTDATLAGNPASALLGGPYRISVLEKFFGRRFGSPGSIDEITQAMLEGGPGVRGIVFGSRGTQVGHVFNVVNQNGVVRYLDGQSGGKALLEGYEKFQLLRTN